MGRYHSSIERYDGIEVMLLGQTYHELALRLHNGPFHVCKTPEPPSTT